MSETPRHRAPLAQRKAEVQSRVNVRAWLDTISPKVQPSGADHALICCPAHDEAHPSCNVRLSDSVWHCHACGASGGLFDLAAAAWGCDFLEALHRLEGYCGIANGAPPPPPHKKRPPVEPKSAPQTSPRVVATYDYCDLSGALKYQKQRLEPGRNGRSKEYRFRHPLPGGDYASGRGSSPALLYGLGELVNTAPDTPVYVVEGEKCADLLRRWGLVAVSTDSGAAGAWPDGYAGLFQGRRALVLPDNDEAGERYASRAAAALLDAGANVSALRLPDLPHKGDVADWCAAQRSAGMDDTSIRNAFLSLADNAPSWEATPQVIPRADKETQPVPSAEYTPQRNEGTDAPRRPRGGAGLLALLEGAELYVDPHGGTYIDPTGDGELLPLVSTHAPTLEALSAMHYAATGQTAGRDAISAACAVLSHRARRYGRAVPMAQRACWWPDGALLIDLGGGRAVRIADGSWRQILAPVGAFRPGAGKLPQPDPLPDGDPWRLFDTVPVPPEQRAFVLATLAAGMVPQIARPLLALTGPQGSGKSATARRIKALLDPSDAPLSLMPRKPEDLDLLLSRSACLALDNLSHIGADLADVLCGVLTGATPQRRKLHSDSDVVTLRADVQLIVTGITALSGRPDLLERSLRLELERIEDAQRRADDELEAAFETARPAILGGLFTMLARGMIRLRDYRPPQLPRMAAFARLAGAIAEAAEPGAGAHYLRDFARNQGRQHLELAETNLLFGALVELAERKDYPSGSFGEVAERLRIVADPGPQDRFPTARGLRNALERLRVPLVTAGIRFEFTGRTAHAKAGVRFYGAPRPGDGENIAAAQPQPTQEITLDGDAWAVDGPEPQP